MIWAIGLIVLLVGLLIPLAVFAVDASRARRRGRVARALPAAGSGVEATTALTGRLAVLEDDVDDLRADLAALRDELQDVQRLLEDPEPRDRRGPTPRGGS